jgi:hypothetical protein
MVEGPGCNFEETQGFICKKRAVKARGMDPIRRISIQQLESIAARLTGVDRFDRGQVAIWIA